MRVKWRAPFAELAAVTALSSCGLGLGYRPADFGLERIMVGGELVTEGLKTRCQQLVGPVVFDEGFGMTEVWPFGGTQCERRGSSLHCVL